MLNNLHKEINTNFDFPNINIFNVFNNDTLLKYEIVPSNEYVMYNKDRRDTEFNNEKQEEIQIIYYYTVAYLPKTYDFNNFPWVAVKRNSVDKNYIF